MGYTICLISHKKGVVFVENECGTLNYPLVFLCAVFFPVNIYFTNIMHALG